VRLRGFQQSLFRRTRFRLERTVVGTAGAGRESLHPEIRGARQNAFREAQDAFHVEFFELAGVTVDPRKRELLAQFRGMSVVGLDVGTAGFVLPLMLFNFGVTFWMFRVGHCGQRPVAPAARQEVRGDATPDHAWKLAGLLYFNPRDPAMWVENRIGVGYTLNVGNWRAWLLIIGIMLAPMIAGRLLF
jgi:hypothetical protein